MIVEERIYTLQPGTAPQYLAVYEAEGLAVQKQHLGRMVGYFTTEFGPLNQIVHMWAYRDLAERRVRRAALAADPRWEAFREKVRPLLVTQENKLLMPARFSPWAEEPPA
ncbi:MAG TPA: NIPSNAP family protein [Roseomonas sp.]|jgi:hypothetical protein